MQRQLDGHIRGQRESRADSPCRLAGRIVDGANDPLIATHARKGGQRYHYYVSKGLHTGTIADRSLGMRLPAGEVEQVVAQELASALDDPLHFAERTRLIVQPHDLQPLLARCKALTAELRGNTGPLPALITRVRVLDTRLELELSPTAAGTALGLALAPGAPAVLTLATEVRLTRTGRAIRLIHGNGTAAATSAPDIALAKLVARARSWWRAISEEGSDPSTIAAQEQLSVTYVVRVLRLAFLAPAVIEALLEGKLKAGIDGTALLQTDAIALDWNEQAQLFVAA